MRFIFAGQCMYPWPENLFIRFLKSKEGQGCKNRTLKTYWYRLRQFGNFINEHEEIPKVNGSLFEKRYFRQSLIYLHREILKNTAYNKRGSLEYVHTLNQYISAWRGFSEWLAAIEGVKAGHRIKISLFQKPLRLPKIIELDYFFQIDPYRVNRTFKDWRNFCIVDLFASAGLRITEVVKLKVGDISPKKCEITLNSRFSHPRKIFLHQQSHQFLLTYIELLCQKFGMKKLNPKFSLFINSNGTALSTAALSDITKKWMWKHLSVCVNPLTLRQTYACNLYFKTNDLLTTKILMGYSGFNPVIRFELVNIDAMHKECRKHPRYYRRMAED